MKIRTALRWGIVKRITTISLILYLPFLFYDLYARDVEMKFYSQHMDGISENGTGFDCLIPDFDPYDPTVWKFYERARPIKCGDNQPFLTYLDDNGFIRFNTSQPEKYDCSYSEVLRPDGEDGEVYFGLPQVFRGSERVVAKSGFIRVRCYIKSTLVYEDLHFYVPLPMGMLHESTVRKPGKHNTRWPNVMIFTIDSMSRLNFIRQLPRTYHVLTKIINVTVFKGMTKTGDNTYPNMIPFLTGQHLPRPKFYDEFPFVWNTFSQNGYVTMFNEDFPYLSLFNYLAKGFKRPPTDYYVRPFWLAVEQKEYFGSSDWRCSGNTPKHVYFMKYVKKFVRRLHGHRYFTFNFITGLSHEDLNLVQVGDEDFAAAFLQMWKEGLLDNTVLMVMGDHGNRFSGLRRTHIGRVESNMPFLAVRLPDGLIKQYPHLQEGLNRNSNRLISWYDWYEMLMDLANNNLGPESTAPHYGTKGISPFRTISHKRTCADAGIPEEYCICTRETQIPVNETQVRDVAANLLDHINSVLLSGARRCASLALTSILSAQLLTLGRQVANPRGFRVMYRVTIQVAPSEGVFEGTLELDAWSKKAKVVGDVNRLNLYGNQSLCVHDTITRLYCYCQPQSSHGS